MTPTIRELRGRFNAQAGAVRIITFLSPTCGPCRFGQGVVRGLFEAFPDSSLRGYVVWVPMLTSDNEDAAAAEQSAISDQRLDFWYDADKSAASEWSTIMGLETPAWDVYGVYGPTDTWTDIAPPPRIWMHQLDFDPGTRPADRLDTKRLADEFLALLGDDPTESQSLAASIYQRGLDVSSR